MRSRWPGLAVMMARTWIIEILRGGETDCIDASDEEREHAADPLVYPRMPSRRQEYSDSPPPGIPFRAPRTSTPGDSMGTRFSVNGRAVDVKAEPDTPLFWVIRDEIGLTGTKFGCGASLCGACTVHLDGVPVRSCQTPLSAVAGRKVATIESLSRNNTHPLQKAWIAHAVPQLSL